jgi:hypothetical protein
LPLVCAADRRISFLMVPSGFTTSPIVSEAISAKGDGRRNKDI